MNFVVNNAKYALRVPIYCHKLIQTLNQCQLNKRMKCAFIDMQNMALNNQTVKIHILAITSIIRSVELIVSI